MAFITSFSGIRLQSRTASNSHVASTSPRRASVFATATSPQKASLKTQYEQLESMTTIVEDTGEIEKIRAHSPHSATTNPSLVAKAATLPEYAHLVEEAVAYGKGRGVSAGAVLPVVRNKLFTMFGAQILKYVPGDVSTEVDARLSFDVERQVETGLELIRMYEEVGIGKERVLIKLATTWEGVQACRVLEGMGVKTNMTLLFSKAQAIAAADAGAYLISPFVGRILDWYKKEEGVDGYESFADPGVVSVKEIYEYYKCVGYGTIVMGASFRNKGEILELAGCDRLTISPQFIADLKESCGEIERKLEIPTAGVCSSVDKISMDEKRFRWEMNENAMATEKLAHGIRGFAADLEKLDRQLEKLLG